MTAVLTQKYPMGHKPLAYYSGQVNPIMQGHFPCEQALAAAVFSVDKSTSIVMGSPLTLYGENTEIAVIQKSRSTLTIQRVSGYALILSRPALKVVRCHVVTQPLSWHTKYRRERNHTTAPYTLQTG